MALSLKISFYEQAYQFLGTWDIWKGCPSFFTILFIKPIFEMMPSLQSGLIFSRNIHIYTHNIFANMMIIMMLQQNLECLECWSVQCTAVAWNMVGGGDGQSWKGKFCFKKTCPWNIGRSKLDQGSWFSICTAVNINAFFTCQRFWTIPDFHVSLFLYVLAYPRPQKFWFHCSTVV